MENKKEYIVKANVEVSFYTKVEANSKEEAKELALDRSISELCYNPFIEECDESWHIELDLECIDEIKSVEEI